jgi:hypothetical protein
MPDIILKNQSFSYRITRKPIRSLRLQITSKNSFSISAPRLLPIFEINRFIKKHSSWIISKSSQIHQPSFLSSLSSLSILDQPYSLIFRQSVKNSLTISSSKKQIIIFTSSLSQSHLSKLFQSYLKPFAKKLISSEIKKFTQFSYNRLTVRNQKSRFGSCSSRGNLNFNWQIILFPPDQFRHIILHELVHLHVKNHSKKFWKTLSSLDPNCKANNLWLRRQGTAHYIITP